MNFVLISCDVEEETLEVDVDGKPVAALNNGPGPNSDGVK